MLSVQTTAEIFLLFVCFFPCFTSIGGYFQQIIFDSECRKCNFVKTLFIDDMEEAKSGMVCDSFCYCCHKQK